MIQLYSQSNTNFDSNGDIILLPLDCHVSVSLNAEWVLTLTHPLDDEGRFRFIQPNAVIKAPSFNGEQLFRIYNVDESDNSINATAYPIFLDSANEVFIVDKRAINVNGQSALNTILSGTKYSGISDIINLKTAYFVQMNAMSAINGDDDNSFINRWGGQIIYDNFKIKINNKVGSDKGVVVEYGKNITGITATISYNDICTRIFPKAYNGYTLANDAMVDSPLINSYPIVYTKVIEYEDIKLKSDASDDEESYANLTELRNALKVRAKQEFENGIDKPTVTLEINICLLENTQEYAKYKNLENISLGDTVTCKHSKLGIKTTAQAISLVYNCLTNRTEQVTLGQFQTSFFNAATLTSNKVNGAIRSDGTINAQHIQGAIDAAKAQLRQQVDASQRQEVRAILFEDNDKSSDLYGALSIGTKGIEIANERIQENNPYSEWNWRTAITANGVFADEITGKLSRFVEMQAELGTIGGWKIDKDALYSDYDYEIDSNGNNCYRVYLQSFLKSNGKSTWAISVQQGKKDINGNFSGIGKFYVTYDGGCYCNNGLNVTGNLKMDSYLYDGRNYQVIGINNNLVFGYGAYTLEQPTYIEGGKVLLRYNNDGVAIQNKTSQIFLLNVQSWKFGNVDSDYVNRDTIESSGGFVLSANNGTNAMYLYAKQILFLTDNIYLRNSAIKNGTPSSNTNLITGANGEVTVGAGAQSGDTRLYTNSNGKIRFCYSTVGTRFDFYYNNNLYWLYTPKRLVFDSPESKFNSDLFLNFGTTSGTAALYVNSNCKVTTASSSERYKENITKEFEKWLDPDNLYDLPVFQYNYKEEFKDNELVEGTQIGITAEGADKYYPNACIYNANGEPESWQERIMIPAMLKLIQRQKSEIDNLEAEQAKQNERITALENTINQLVKK